MRSKDFTKALASSSIMCAEYFHVPETLGVQRSRDSSLAGISEKHGSTSHPALSKNSALSISLTTHLPETSSRTKPAEVRADSLAECPAVLRKRLRSLMRPAAATSAVGQNAVHTPKPVSLASEVETNWFQPFPQLCSKKTMRPAKTRNS